MFENIGIIDDNETSQKVLSTILSKIENEENISLNIFKFLSPIEYILCRKEFDILIISSLFKSCSLSLNSFSISKIIKEKNSIIKIILVSEYTNEGFLKLINSEIIDYYISKRVEEDRMKHFFKLIIKGEKIAYKTLNI